ncbi:RICIN domain-containing protein [Streptomyces sp. NPDC003077]|uniref:RICIN domain-containing protein n=1 Tax=Streptomyces sp. NPDC003077 TaxID=3154443 RepID=UPI0033AAAAE5
MAQLLPNGVYVIRNAAFEDRVADLSGANPEPNTPIIGWPYHKGDNQQWELQSTNGANLYIIKSKITSGTSYFALSDLRIFPPQIAGQPYYEKWSIEPVGEGKYRIHFPYIDGTATLREEKEGTQVTLEHWRGASQQMWRFDSV